MKKYFSIFTLFYFLSACLTPDIASNSPYCSQVLDSIQKTWKFDDTLGYYTANYKWLVELNNRGNETTTCFIGKDTAYITKIFGRKYEFRNSRKYFPFVIIYPLSKPCSGHGKDYHCSSLQFFFDSSQVVKRIIFEEWMAGEFH